MPVFKLFNPKSLTGLKYFIVDKMLDSLELKDTFNYQVSSIKISTF